MSGGILERGDIVRGDFVLGGYCPGGYCPGDIVRGDIVRGDIVLEPRKTCIKHTFLTKKIMKKKIYFTDLPTLIFFGPLQETNNFFF